VVESEQQDIVTLGSASSAYVATGALPDKITPLVRATMDQIKLDDNSLRQKRAAATLCLILKGCRSREKSPAPKIIKNSCTPLFTLPIAPEILKATEGCITLKVLEAPPTAGALAQDTGYRGSRFVLTELAKSFGADLFNHLPSLWSLAFDPTTLPQDVTIEDIVVSLQIMSGLFPSIHQGLRSQVSQ